MKCGTRLECFFAMKSNASILLYRYFLIMPNNQGTYETLLFFHSKILAPNFSSFSRRGICILNTFFHSRKKWTIWVNSIVVMKKLSWNTISTMGRQNKFEWNKSKKKGFAKIILTIGIKFKLQCFTKRPYSVKLRFRLQRMKEVP